MCGLHIACMQPSGAAAWLYMCAAVSVRGVEAPSAASQRLRACRCAAWARRAGAGGRPRSTAMLPNSIIDHPIRSCLSAPHHGTRYRALTPRAMARLAAAVAGRAWPDAPRRFLVIVY